MVASEEGQSILEADLQSNEKSDSLNGVVATVDVIAHEKEVRVWGMSTNLEQLSEVVELTVDVSADGDWCTDLLNVGFINKNFFCLKRIQNLTVVRQMVLFVKFELKKSAWSV